MFVRHKQAAAHAGGGEALFSTPPESPAARKERFLAALASRNPHSINKYKRSLDSPLRYAGGKSLGVGHIAEKLPPTVARIVSPFFGGGSFEIAANLRLGLPVVGFDIFGILANYWQVQIARPRDLHRALLKFSPDPAGYAEVKQQLKRHWNGEKKLGALALAAHYYFNHNLSYGPGFLGWPSKIYMNRARYHKMLEKVRDFNCPGLEVYEGDFGRAFAEYPDDFFYCDPPYLLGGDSKMFRGIYPQRNFPIHHNNFPHERLRDLLLSHRGGFILSYNDCPQVREMYRDFEMTFPRWQYTLGQGETRIGCNRLQADSRTNIKQDHEILIFSPPSIFGCRVL